MGPRGTAPNPSGADSMGLEFTREELEELHRLMVEAGFPRSYRTVYAALRDRESDGIAVATIVEVDGGYRLEAKVYGRREALEALGKRLRKILNHSRELAEARRRLVSGEIGASEVARIARRLEFALSDLKRDTRDALQDLKRIGISDYAHVDISDEDPCESLINLLRRLL